MSFGCFETEEIEIFEQEGIDYFKKNSEFLLNYQKKIKLLDKNNAKIPLITHQIYLTNLKSPKKMDNISLSKTIRSIKLLNDASSDFKHFIWVNSFDIIPQEITILPGVEIHHINELANLEIWQSLSKMLDSDELTSAIFAKASDLIRYAALYLHGGLYRDLDYEVYKPEKFLLYLNNFDLFVGKEFDDHEPVYVGSALVASVASHKVIAKALDLLQRNLNSEISQLPEYLQYPCDTLNYQLYQTGPAVITMAFFIAANQDSNNDILLPANILYNWEYAKATTPDSPCHVPEKNIQENPDTIGADMFCGHWHKNNTRFYYKKNVDYYLYFAAQDGDLEKARKSVSDGADVNKIFSSTGATPLYIASQNGHYEIVKLLVENNANINQSISPGRTALYAAVCENNLLIIDYFLKKKALLTMNQDDKNILLNKVKSLKNEQISKLFENAEKKVKNSLNNNLPAYNINCFPGLTEEVFALEDIDFESRTNELKKDFFEKILNVDLYEKRQNNPIPRISHQVYITSIEDLKPIDDIAIKKIISNIEGLIALDKNWRFIFWTNNPRVIPDNVQKLPNVEIRLIEELSSATLYKNIQELIKLGTISSYTEACDLVRYSVLHTYGGLYYDLDYQFYNFEKLWKFINSFNLLVGKEFSEEFSQVGSSIVGAVVGHPVINQMVEWIKRNFDPSGNIPPYLESSCTLYNLRMFKDGPALLSLAVYKKANNAGYNDLVDMTSRAFFNIEYAHYTTPGSKCYKPNKPAELVNFVNGVKVETIGSDMLCGGWTPPNYFDSIFYPENIATYLYLASQDGLLEDVEKYIEYGVDVNQVFNQTSVTPLYIAVQNGHVKVAEKLINSGASIWFRSENGLSIKKASILSEDQITINFISDKFKEILYQEEFRCFQGDIEDIFIHENVNYKLENKKLVDSAKEKFSHIDTYKTLNKNPINKITHQIYFSFNSNAIPSLLIEKTKISLNRLNDYDPSWEHFIWINDQSIIPEELLKIKGVKLRDINDLKNNQLFYLVDYVIGLAKNEKVFLTQLSDILRLIILLEEGGVYRDFDYEIYRAKELEELLEAFNFVAGKEKYTDISFIGNAFIASIKNHPIIKTSLDDYIKRNFDSKKELLPLYLQYPCNKSVKVIFETGSPVITNAYFKSANQNGNFDLVMSANVFYNIKYAWENTPESRCYLPTKNASLDQVIDGEVVKTIGSDMFCGSSHTRELIEYPGNENIYLYLAAQEGEYDKVKRLLLDGNDPNVFMPSNLVTPLAIAAQNGYFDIVKLLMDNGAKVDFNKDGYTPLYRAIQEENYEIAQYLLDKKADINFLQANEITPLFYAVYKNWPKMVNFLIKHKADQQIKFKDETPYQYALSKGYLEILKEFHESDYQTEIVQTYSNEVVEQFVGDSNNYFPEEI